MTAEFALAVHALVYLLHKNTVISSAELADNICTNPARVRKVMAKLHKAGLVEALQGKGSGYRSIPDSASISLNRVLAALGEEPVTLSWRSGDIDRDCMVSSGMSGIMEDIYGGLNEACVKKLASVTIGAVNDAVFSGERIMKSEK